MGAAEDFERPFTETEAARLLGVSKATLMRERVAGKIHPYRLGERLIRYDRAILDEYLRQCRNAPDKSATTGSASGLAHSSGAEHGSTPLLDRQSAHHLAQATFRKPSSRSGSGSPSTAE